MSPQGKGLIIAAPSSGSGKTTVTLGLLRALRNQGVAVRGAKSGPDYIDPKFHEAACGMPCFNLDAWAMSSERIAQLAAGPELLVIEGAMGLFDGAPPDGKGAVADLARQLELPVVLVIDAARMAQSIAPLVAGFSKHDSKVKIAGVVLNKVGSLRHETMLRRALKPLSLPVLGVLPRDQALEMPSRHLGLVQASEHPKLESFLEEVAKIVTQAIDIKSFKSIFETCLTSKQPASENAITARRIAIGQDAAFTFFYPHILKDWTAAGVEVLPFSPLNNETVPDADLVYLPGGYPELHAERLAAAQIFLESLKKASESTEIYGECGGYMALGETLTDANGVVHNMAGLLPLQTSFAERKLHLGYRNLTAKHGPFQGNFKGHEFHYATTLKADGPPLFEATDAEGTALPAMGLRQGRVYGSFAHIIDRDLS